MCAMRVVVPRIMKESPNGRSVRWQRYPLVLAFDLAHTLLRPVVLGLLDAFLAGGDKIPPDDAGAVERFAADDRATRAERRGDRRWRSRSEDRQRERRHVRA